jgi:hypothetical protein
MKLIDGHLWHRYSVTVNQAMVIGVDRKSFEAMTSTWPIGTLGSVVSLLAATLFQEILIETTSSGMSDQLRDIYSICRYCCNVVTYKWKVHNGKIVINFEVYVKVWNRPSCICGILYLKLNGIGVINEITKLFIYIEEREIKGLC